MNAQDNTNNVDGKLAELKAQMAALEEQKAAIEREAREAERKAREEAERQARLAKRAETLKQWTPVANAMVAALKAAGFKNAKWAEPKDDWRSLPVFFVTDSYDGDLSLDLEAITESSRVYRATIKGYAFKVGTYGNRKNYPQKKDGTFNYDKIATELKERQTAAIEAKQRRDNAKKAETNNKARVGRLATKFGQPAYQGADYNNIPNVVLSYEFVNHYDRSRSVTQRRDNDLQMTIQHLTEDEAAQVLAFLKENGLLKK